MTPVLKNTIRLVLMLCFTLTGEISLAQATPNACDFPNVTCGIATRNGIINSFGTDTIQYATVGRSMPFWFAIGDVNTGHIDTSANCIFNIVKLGGVGNIEGNTFTKENKYAYYDSISFSEVGLYKIMISEGHSQFLDTLYFNVILEINFCSESPGGDCGTIKGNKIFAKARGSNVIPVDAVFPITVGVIDSISQLLDSTYIGTIYVEKVSGPGTVYGSLSMTGNKWFNFNNIKFSQEGAYTIKFYEEDSLKYKSAYVDAVVIGVTGLSQIESLQLHIYPNPFSDQFYVNFPQKEEQVTVSIFDNMGKKVSGQVFNNPGKDIIISSKDVNSGVYLLSIRSSSGSFASNSIIIKK